ncbi:ORF65 [black bullhead herpesvirus]|uniref:ORF65 n=1 Tax=black bullhead herpesvirus TaxID=508441 RepID=A0A2H5AJK0_9VIRU|nr:ORF65 [black bullhead herpesvirus]AUG72314.1 ORF65 [black bullhead herpesvirus]
MELNEAVGRLTSFTAPDPDEVCDDCPSFRFKRTEQRPMIVFNHIAPVFAGTESAILEDDTVQVAVKYALAEQPPQYKLYEKPYGSDNKGYLRGLRKPDACIRMMHYLNLILHHSKTNPLIRDAIRTMNLNLDLYTDMTRALYNTDDADRVFDPVAPQFLLGGALYRLLHTRNRFYPKCAIGVVGPFNECVDSMPGSSVCTETTVQAIATYGDTHPGSEAVVTDLLIEWILETEVYITQQTKKFICKRFQRALCGYLPAGMFHDIIIFGLGLTLPSTAIAPIERKMGIDLFWKTQYVYYNLDLEGYHMAVANAPIRDCKILDSGKGGVEHAEISGPADFNVNAPFPPTPLVVHRVCPPITCSKFITCQIVDRQDSVTPKFRKRSAIVILAKRDIDLRRAAIATPVLTDTLLEHSFSRGYFVPIFLRGYKSMHGLWDKLNIPQRAHPLYIYHKVMRSNILRFDHAIETQMAPEGFLGIVEETIEFYRRETGELGYLGRVVQLIGEQGFLPLFARGDAAPVQVFGFVINLCVVISEMGYPNEGGDLQVDTMISTMGPVVFYVWLLTVIYPLYIATTYKPRGLDGLFKDTYRVGTWNYVTSTGALFPGDNVERVAIHIDYGDLHKRLCAIAPRLGLTDVTMCILNHFIFPILSAQLPYAFTRAPLRCCVRKPTDLVNAVILKLAKKYGRCGSPPYIGPVTESTTIPTGKYIHIINHLDEYPEYLKSEESSLWRNSSTIGGDEEDDDASDADIADLEWDDTAERNLTRTLEYMERQVGAGRSGELLTRGSRHREGRPKTPKKEGWGEGGREMTEVFDQHLANINNTLAVVDGMLDLPSTLGSVIDIKNMIRLPQVPETTLNTQFGTDDGFIRLPESPGYSPIQTLSDPIFNAEMGLRPWEEEDTDDEGGGERSVSGIIRKYNSLIEDVKKPPRTNPREMVTDTPVTQEFISTAPAPALPSTGAPIPTPRVATVQDVPKAFLDVEFQLPAPPKGVAGTVAVVGNNTRRAQRRKGMEVKRAPDHPELPEAIDDGQPTGPPRNPPPPPPIATPRVASTAAATEVTPAIAPVVTPPATAATEVTPATAATEVTPVIAPVVTPPATAATEVTPVIAPVVTPPATAATEVTPATAPVVTPPAIAATEVTPATAATEVTPAIAPVPTVPSGEPVGESPVAPQDRVRFRSMYDPLPIEKLERERNERLSRDGGGAETTDEPSTLVWKEESDGLPIQVEAAPDSPHSLKVSDYPINEIPSANFTNGWTAYGSPWGVEETGDDEPQPLRAPGDPILDRSGRGLIRTPHFEFNPDIHKLDLGGGTPGKKLESHPDANLLVEKPLRDLALVRGEEKSLPRSSVPQSSEEPPSPMDNIDGVMLMDYKFRGPAMGPTLAEEFDAIGEEVEPPVGSLPDPSAIYDILALDNDIDALEKYMAVQRRGTQHRRTFGTQTALAPYRALILRATGERAGPMATTDPKATERLEIVLREANLKRVHVPGDGNCMYASLRFFVGADNLSVEAYKQKLLLDIERAVEKLDSDTRGLMMEELENLRKKDVYGSGNVIEHFQNLTNINISIVTWNDAIGKLVAVNGPKALGQIPCGALLYFNQHYEPLIPMDTEIPDCFVNDFIEWKRMLFQIAVSGN